MNFLEKYAADDLRRIIDAAKNGLLTISDSNGGISELTPNAKALITNILTQYLEEAEGMDKCQISQNDFTS